ncbi:AtpZ/AtpI family protein [bacterium]|nr:AtpZ/AtpI family protein [bacterium]MBT3794979.1 AtpZ/AtpI family protein [bacterium]MBT4634630.1 AtpZ/AtpI family protein [bacterium]
MGKNTLWIKFVVIGSELAILILAGIFIGNKLDIHFDTLPIFTILGVIFGSIGGFSLMFKLLKRLNIENDKKK